MRFKYLDDPGAPPPRDLDPQEQEKPSKQIPYPYSTEDIQKIIRDHALENLAAKRGTSVESLTGPNRPVEIDRVQASIARRKAEAARKASASTAEASTQDSYGGDDLGRADA